MHKISAEIFDYERVLWATSDWMYTQCREEVSAINLATKERYTIVECAHNARIRSTTSFLILALGNTLYCASLPQCCDFASFEKKTSADDFDVSGELVVTRNSDRLSIYAVPSWEEIPCGDTLAAFAQTHSFASKTFRLLEVEKSAHSVFFAGRYIFAEGTSSAQAFDIEHKTVRCIPARKILSVFERDGCYVVLSPHRVRIFDESLCLLRSEKTSYLPVWCGSREIVGLSDSVYGTYSLFSCSPSAPVFPGIASAIAHDTFLCLTSKRSCDILFLESQQNPLSREYSGKYAFERHINKYNPN